jgi:hypothetical protein
VISRRIGPIFQSGVSFGSSFLASPAQSLLSKIKKKKTKKNKQNKSDRKLGFLKELGKILPHW